MIKSTPYGMLFFDIIPFATNKPHHSLYHRTASGTPFGFGLSVPKHFSNPERLAIGVRIIPQWLSFGWPLKGSVCSFQTNFPLLNRPKHFPIPRPIRVYRILAFSQNISCCWKATFILRFCKKTNILLKAIFVFDIIKRYKKYK